MNNFSLRQSCSSLLYNLDSHFPLVQQAVTQLASSTLGNCPTACWTIKKPLLTSPYQGRLGGVSSSANAEFRQLETEIKTQLASLCYE